MSRLSLTDEDARRVVQGLFEVRLAVLQRCERGEAVALHRHREAMQAPPPPSVRERVASRYEGAHLDQDRVRALRDRARRPRRHPSRDGGPPEPGRRGRPDGHAGSFDTVEP